MTASFTLPWPPSVNAAYRSVVVGRSARVLLSREGRAYKQRAAWALLAQKVPSFGTARVSVSVALYPPDRRRRDLDNLGKILIDALMPQVLDDDSQIDQLSWGRMDVVKGGRAEIYINALHGG